ncbi:D-cysteine desulfhydrase family protein [Saccharopolyspora shandongensis]|uniref:D-cysteine desulfhydrase family protein n=1 Tax=Saccharopolyspora shandongensis TaxID=418495 RepID=UPI003449963A
MTATGPTSSAPHRVALGTWPSPLEPAPRLAAALGLGKEDLWFKRDDLVGLGGGGNKTRKLEFTVASALAAGADTLVTVGAPQSNHARLTAAAGARLGLDVVLVFPGYPGGTRSGNITLDALFGVRVHWAGKVAREQLDEIARDIANQLRKDGAHPAVIPFGGSSPVGAQGYVRAGEELSSQLPGAHTSVVALGSGGTMAGLVAALGSEHVLGIDTGAVAEPANVVSSLATDTSGRTITAEGLHIRTDQVGEDYAHLTEATADAIELTARTEGVVLDPTYTGRAMAGLIAAVRDGMILRGQTTVFWHTGGLPGLFGHPHALQRFESTLRQYP